MFVILITGTIISSRLTPPMLKGIAVVIHVVIVVIRIAKKDVFFCEDIRRIYRGYGQSGFLRIPKGEYFFSVVVQIPSVFVSKIGCRLLVSDHLRSGRTMMKKEGKIFTKKNFSDFS